MKIKQSTFVKAYAYFKDQLDLAIKKENNDKIVRYYENQINSIFTRYYSQ